MCWHARAVWGCLSCRWLPRPALTLLPLQPPPQINDLLGNSAAETLGAAATQPVVLGGSTDAELAAGQAVQQQQGQPLVGQAAVPATPTPSPAPANGTR